MKINFLEHIIVSPPFQFFIQRYLDLPLLLSWAKLPKRLNILELGCGVGHTSRYLNKILKPKQYTATDKDAETIRQAENRNDQKSRIIFQVADVEKLIFPDKSFDAVIEMNVLHTFTNWKKGVREIHRVLKPGGKLILRDLSIETFTVPVVGIVLRQLIKHSYEHMYDQKEFLSYLRRCGFTVTHESDSSWCLFLVAEKNK